MSKPPFLKATWLDRDAVPSFDVYPFSIAAVRSLDRIDFHPKVTFLVGDNGTGKSTLLEALAVAEGLNPEGGSRNFCFSTRESHSCLPEYLKFERGIRPLRKADGYFLRAESFYNVATEIEKLGVSSSYGDKSLHEQSHGESFWSLVSERFGGNGLYLLDEPEAALSPSRQLSLIAIMHQLTDEGSQFIIATHSPILMAFPEAHIYELSHAGVRPVEYEQTEHYKITKSFLDNPQRMLRELLKPSN